MSTVNKLFGIADPQYDALRILSTQALEAGPGNGIIGGGGLLNHIYLWPADGSSITDYEPTEAGLIAALAAATTGDTVWLPSIAIPSTSAVTVPEGVTLIGISDNAAVSFSGFSGAAITLSAGSSVFGFAVTLVGSGADAIGIDARATASRVEHMTIVVSGGSTRNVRVLTGINAQAGVVEVWTIDRDVTIAWAPCDGSTTPLAWNTIALPATFVSPLHVNEFAHSLEIDHLGHYLYVGGMDSGNSDRGTVWQLANLAAIRAAPATAPSWSVIAYDSQVTTAGTLKAAGLTGAFYIRCFGDTLYLRADSTGPDPILGIYDGSAWTWKNGVGGDLTSSYQAVYGDVYADLHSISMSYLRNWNTGAIIGTGFDQLFGINHFSEIWRRFDAPNYYTHPIIKPDNTTCLRETTTGTETLISSTGSNPQSAATVRGAYISDAIYSVDSDGDLRVSSNGLAYSNVATWVNGWAMNTVIDGSGNLIWLIKAQSDTNPVVRLYSTAGAVLADLTGNLWTVLHHPVGTVSFDQMWLVYGGGAAGDRPIIADIHAGSVSGTGAWDVEVDGEAIILDADLDTIQTDSGIAYVSDVSYTTHSGVGAIEPQWGDRGAWDVGNYPPRHASDINDATFDYHNDPDDPPLSAALTDGHIFVGNVSNVATDVAMSNDATIINTGALTLKNTGPGATGPLGGATVAPIITIDAKGRVTALSSATITGVTPAAHQLDGALHTVSGLTPGYILTALTASTFGFAAAPAGSVPRIYNETISADGISTIYYLVNIASPGTICVYINGIRQPATDDLAPTDVVQFSSPPALGALLLFDYEMELA